MEQWERENTIVILPVAVLNLLVVRKILLCHAFDVAGRDQGQTNAMYVFV